MKTNEKKNTSAKKKLIPAVAMLTTSAVMLSTATYAWFTLSKTAEVTGLKMTATTGGSLEISLGELDNNIPKANGSDTSLVSTPSMTNDSWTSKVAISDYYKSIGYIKPASSNTALSLWAPKQDDIYAGGTKVKEATEVTAADTPVKLQLKTAAGDSLTQDKAESSQGYYVDIPMWIRSTSSSDQTVKCYVTITDNQVTEPDTATTANDLEKAVRVAVIPINTANDSSTATEAKDALNIGKLATRVATSDGASVFATDWSYYSKGTQKPNAVSKAGTTYSSTLAELGFKQAEAKETTPTGQTTGYSNVFTLAKAEQNNYSVEGFVVRVWLEGESKYCNDATAAQDWNIQLNFVASSDANNGD